MSPSPPDRLAVTIAQLNPIVGDIAGNADKARRARARGGRATAPISSCSPNCSSAAIRPRTWCSSPRFRRPAAARSRRWPRETADGGPAMLIGTPWVEDGRLYNAVALLDGGRVAGAALQGRSAELRRVRRKASVRAGSDAGPDAISAACGSACRSARTSGVPSRSNASSETGGEILLVPNGSPYRPQRDRRAAQRRGRARQGSRPAAASTSTRSAARTNWCSTAPPSSLNADLTFGAAAAVRFARRW